MTSSSTFDAQKHLPLSPPAFAILLVLCDGDKHGYAILREVNETTQGTVRLLPGTLYNLIKRMLEDGWIEELGKRPDPSINDERRRYYHLTSLGQTVVSLETERLASLLNIARQHGILSEESASS